MYISRFMAMLKRFAIENSITVHLVAHQNTAKPNDKDGGRYNKPNLNNIKGGGTFADKADNVLFLWRPNRALDFRCTKVVFGSQKIKKQKLVARPCEVDNIDFDFKSNRYLFDGKTIFNKIDEKRWVEVIKEKNINEIKPATLLDAFGQAPEQDEFNGVPF